VELDSTQAGCLRARAFNAGQDIIKKGRPQLRAKRARLVSSLMELTFGFGGKRQMKTLWTSPLSLLEVD
jgi:hypothetical protein